jgi:hypothetical protein
VTVGGDRVHAFSSVAVVPGEIRLGDTRLPAKVDPIAGVVEVRCGEHDYRLRAWTFRERRYALAARLGPDASLDTDGVVTDAARWLVEPPCREEDAPVVGLAALAWSAVAGGAYPAPAPNVDPAVQTVALARALGWRPADIDSGGAAEVDRWYAAVTGTIAEAAPDAQDEGFVDYRLEE